MRQAEDKPGCEASDAAEDAATSPGLPKDADPVVHDVYGYQAREIGLHVEFWNGGEDLLFYVPIETADTQERREALIRVYGMGRIAGEKHMRNKMKEQVRSIFGL